MTATWSWAGYPTIGSRACTRVAGRTGAQQATEILGVLAQRRRAQPRARAFVACRGVDVTASVEDLAQVVRRGPVDLVAVSYTHLTLPTIYSV